MHTRNIEANDKDTFVAHILIANPLINCIRRDNISFMNKQWQRMQDSHGFLPLFSKIHNF